jgi:hypothetical protein
MATKQPNSAQGREGGEGRGGKAEGDRSLERGARERETRRGRPLLLPETGQRWCWREEEEN